MATVANVEQALQDLIYAALYPNAAPPSVLGFKVKIYPGWPDPGTLDEDMVETADGIPTAAHVAIYPLPSERNTTRMPNERTEHPAPAVTYGLTVAGQVVTVGGAAPNPYVAQNLAVFVNGKPYVHQALAGQTPAQIAAALRALIVADVPGTTVVGAQITLPAGARIDRVRLGSTGSTTREVRRQERQFSIVVFSSHPTSRAAVADAFDAQLADTPRLALADGTVAQLTYHGSREDDFAQKQRIYRRTLTYVVEFATTITEQAAQMVAGEVDSFASDGTPLNVTYS